MSENQESKSKPTFGSATIYDIAQLAGVNPSTVSRALNKPGRINAKTEEKIREAARQLNYRANPMARSLPTGRTKMLALMIADITNPVFFDAVRGAERAASERGYITVLAESQESSINEAEAIERILPAVDGVVFVTSRLSENEIREMSLTKPVVLMNRKVQDVENVVPNFEPGVREAVEHLKNLGHQRLAYLAGPENAWMSNHRWELILDHAVSMGLNVVQIGPASPTVEGGRGALKLVRAAGVSAVITYNDVMAIGLVKQAQEEGLNIPADLSVVGIDDIFAAGLSTPGLTTIKAPLAETGELAVKSLLEILDELPLSTNSQTLTTNLVIRGTTAKIGN